MMIDGLTKYEAVEQPPPCLEQLPPEIQIIILKRLPNITSLSSLVHASPTYHSTYLDNRQAIFTTITLRTLQSRRSKILPSCSAAQVCLQSAEPPCAEVQSAFQSLYKQVRRLVPPRIISPVVAFIPKHVQRKLRMRLRPQPCYDPPTPITGDERIMLSLNQCLALLKVRHMVPYWRVKEGALSPRATYQC